MKKEYNFKKGQRVDPSRVDTSEPKTMISLRLDPHVISMLREEADALGVGYQTLIGDILKKHISPASESFEEKMEKRILKRINEKLKKKNSA
jgi:uncharacterized protein (DUF4415 family)